MPRWGLHGAAAFDLAVTCGMRAGQLSAAVDSGARPAEDYEARKRSHLHTQELCEGQGIQFLPMVVEAAGGWAPTALRVWRDLAAAEAERLFQALGMSCSAKMPALCSDGALKPWG